MFFPFFWRILMAILTLLILLFYLSGYTFNSGYLVKCLYNAGPSWPVLF